MSIIFPLGKSLCFVQKGSLLCSEESVFCIKGVPFMSPKVSVLKNKGSFFLSEGQWKGVSFDFGEQSYVLPFADEWRDGTFCSFALLNTPLDTLPPPILRK